MEHKSRGPKIWLPVALLLLVGLLLLLQSLHWQLATWDAYYGAISRPELGHLGRPARTVLVGEKERLAYGEARQQHGFNAWLASRIPLRRQLPDIREQRCNRSYVSEYTDLSQVSLILVYRNELPAMLLRTLHSIYARTDRELIMELLLVDDASDMSELDASALLGYVQTHFDEQVRFFRLPEPVGKIRARVFGADEANADVLVFLDAHLEVTEGWLEPLLYALVEDRQTISVPMLDELDEQTLAYRRVEERRNLFDWSLVRQQLPLPAAQRRALPQPYEMPLLLDTVFAVDTLYFDELLQYDEQLRGLAGGDLELSLKTWRCGGRVLQIPCSRMAHLKRRDLGYLRRYGNLSQMGADHARNYKRITELWLGDYKKEVYRRRPQILLADGGDISLPKLYHNDCKTFDWYLENVASDMLQRYPLTELPVDFATGRLRPLAESRLCLTGNLADLSVNLSECEDSRPQNWTLSHLRDLQLAQNNSFCLELRETSSIPTLILGLGPCHNMGGYQFWFYNATTQSFSSNRRCLELNTAHGIVMEECDDTIGLQLWKFDSVNETALEMWNEWRSKDD